MPIVSLTHWTQQFSTPGEQAFLGITMMLVGVLLVLTILVLISFAVGLMSNLISKPSKKESENTAPISKQPEVVKHNPIVSAQAAAGNDQAVIAAIAAAVQMMMQNEGSAGANAGFRIRSIRRV